MIEDIFHSSAMGQFTGLSIGLFFTLALVSMKQQRKAASESVYVSRDQLIRAGCPVPAQEGQVQQTLH